MQRDRHASDAVRHPAPWRSGRVLWGAGLVLFALCLALLGRSVESAELEGVVVAVADGDTVTVLDGQHRQHRVRLAYVDSPESGQAFGRVARQALAARVFRQPVRVEVIDTDRYGRSVAVLWQGTQDINLAQLQAGMAWHYTRYAQQQVVADYRAYQQAQQQARQSQLGLWRDARPVPPWDWRKEQRQEKTRSRDGKQP